MKSRIPTKTEKQNFSKKKNLSHAALCDVLNPLILKVSFNEIELTEYSKIYDTFISLSQFFFCIKDII